MLTVVVEEGARREDVSLLDDVVREGARRMLTAALEAEVDAYLAELSQERNDRGRRLVGTQWPRAAAGGDDRGRCRGDAGAAGHRQAQWTDDYHAFCQRDLSAATCTGQ